MVGVKKSMQGKEKRGRIRLESMEKFLGTRKLKGRLCYESPKKKIASHTFKHLIQNLKLYNRVCKGVTRRQVPFKLLDSPRS